MLLLIVLSIGMSTFAQEKEISDFNRNELKGNAAYLLGGIFEGTYERLLNDESGLGISAAFSLVNDSDLKFAITPYYRFYFGKKPAAGFFAEGFGMLNRVDDLVFDVSNNFNGEVKTITDFAFGLGAGSKWISRRGVIFEISAGVGRNLFSEYNDNRDYEFIGRGSITIGYRF